MLEDLKTNQLSLFRDNSKLKVGVIDFKKDKRKALWTKYGLDAVLEELNSNNVHRCTIDETDRYDIVLFSATSPLDIFELIKESKNKKKQNLLIGGQGCYSPLSLLNMEAKVFFGRAENIVNDLVHSNVTTKSLLDLKSFNDSNEYEIRRARRLLDGETTVGCKNKCKFCQYAHTRNYIGPLDYTPTTKGYIVNEDTWQSFKIKTGHITTALDGWSEKSRKKVRKQVSDGEIIEKLNRCIKELNGTMVLKVFQIVGYPWETLDTVNNDIAAFSELLSKCAKHGKGRVVMMFLCTPFSPEPITPMSGEPVSLIDWRTSLTGNKCRNVYKSKAIEAFILPQTVGLARTLKRVAINRGANGDIIMEMASHKGNSAEVAEQHLKIMGHLCGAYTSQFKLKMESVKFDNNCF